MSIYVTKMFDRLDRIVYARYGSTSNRLVEWVIEQNDGIELYGIVLPMGVSINLPEPPVKVTAVPVLPQLFLWN
ncbi:MULTISPECIES: tail protein X [unclassified Bradyrhizobium]|uniref:tail protein X n=1 Tax=unclassified Bradyrhizobium TaxID=2631580 RepID=UPI0028ED9096|nr:MULTISPECIES: tail protein X [unclassified Bradyrhizobium]